MKSDSLLDAVHKFWFGPPPYERREIWFKKDAAFDAEIRTQFGDHWAQASAGAYDHFAETARGRVALLILLDQFSRNLFRGEARAFSNDAKALALAKESVDNGHDMAVSKIERVFMYLPFEHNEDLADQHRMMALCANLPERNLEWARKHLVIIERFGRFPHRNDALGRETTPEEAAFLTEPDSSF
ncbi:MAG: DUF924 domain-containing protein [Alphaproteobacteria bacterium]|nr:DUF924 domain-containing protein [Alphaproteobacteria bacterium]